MPLKASYSRLVLHFKRPARTSRDTMTIKQTYFLTIRDSLKNISGMGECSTIPGLSIDDEQSYELVLAELCQSIEKYGLYDHGIDLSGFPSIQAGLESAILQLEASGLTRLFDSPFTRGETSLLINGLVWMSDIETMLAEAMEKTASGFNCIKFKTGSYAVEDEIDMIRRFRKSAPAGTEIRLDANGAYQPGEALEILKRFAEFDIHSVEQPIRQGQWEEMARLCSNSPIPVALDEELIGISAGKQMEKLLETIHPAYLILKPSLLGGFKKCDHWIELAVNAGVGWWSTSALESNIGLGAITQWVSTYEPVLPQGLGTGGLYENNLPSSIKLVQDRLYFILP